MGFAPDKVITGAVVSTVVGVVVSTVVGEVLFDPPQELSSRALTIKTQRKFIIIPLIKQVGKIY